MGGGCGGGGEAEARWEREERALACGDSGARAAAADGLAALTMEEADDLDAAEYTLEQASRLATLLQQRASLAEVPCSDGLSPMRPDERSVISP